MSNERSTKSGKDIQPQIFLSEPVRDYSGVWYEQEFMSCWESLAGDKPFFTEVVTTVVERFFFKSYVGFSMRVTIFESNQDMFDWLGEHGDVTAIDVSVI